MVFGLELMPFVSRSTVTRNPSTSRQIHLHRGCYPFLYNKEKPKSDAEWQTDIDERIMYGLGRARELAVIEASSTIVCVQGKRSGFLVASVIDFVSRLQGGSLVDRTLTRKFLGSALIRPSANFSHTESVSSRSSFALSFQGNADLALQR